MCLIVMANFQTGDVHQVEVRVACVPPAARVLLVEDNPDHAFLALTVLHQVLGEWTDVVVAQSHDEAVEILRQFTEFDHPDLVMLDLRLPDDGGFGVLSALRENPALASLPVFVVTSSLFDQDVALSYQLGATAVLAKPLSRAVLRAELKRLSALV